MTSGPPSMPRASKKIVKKIPETRPLRKLSRLRPRPPWTFPRGSVRWMFAALKATTPPQNLPRITPGTKAPFCSAPRSHESCLLIVSSELRPWKDRAGTIKRISTIGTVAIAAPAASGLKALLRPLRSSRPKPRLEMIMAAIKQRIGKIGTWGGPPVTTVTKKALLPTNALSSASPKTSIGLGNLLIDDGC